MRRATASPATSTWKATSSRWLRLGVAGRSEHYSDFGGTVDGKVTARSQADPRVIVRGSASTGFRALARAVVLLVHGDELPESSARAGAGGVGDAARRSAGGAGARRTGRSSRSAHGTSRPVPSSSPARELSVTVDYYRIAIDDRIVLSGNFTAAPDRGAPARRSAPTARGSSPTPSIREPTASTCWRTITWRCTTAGDVRSARGYSHAVTEIVGSVATPPQLAGFESVLFDRIERRRIECGQPERQPARSAATGAATGSA